MRKLHWHLTGMIVVSLVALFSFGDASASSDSTPPIIQPRIIAVGSSAVCPVLPCAVTATLTYNVGVGFTKNAAADFTMIDLTKRKVCVTQSLTPSPIVVGGTNLLMLNATCTVQAGDRMALVYRENPSAPAYVYGLSGSKVHARSPQVVAWVQGTVLGCPPLCTPVG